MSDELVRLLANFANIYETQRDIRRALAAKQSSTLSWRQRGPNRYLYERHRSGREVVLGQESAHTHQLVAERAEEVNADKAQWQDIKTAEAEHGAMIRRLGAGFLDERCATILRGLDWAGLIGREIMTIGSPCVAAYLTHAMAIPSKPSDATADIDFTWIMREEGGRDFLEHLLLIDSTFSLVDDQTSRARNSKGFAADLLVAPAFKRYTQNQRIRPAVLEEQGWLLLGKPVDVVVCSTLGHSCRMFCPDPRYFGLQKLWLSKQEKRDVFKRPKDARQGSLILDLTASRMADYPLTDPFSHGLPEKLKPVFDEWASRRHSALPVTWSPGSDR